MDTKSYCLSFVFINSKFLPLCIGCLAVKSHKCTSFKIPCWCSWTQNFSWKASHCFRPANTAQITLTSAFAVFVLSHTYCGLYRKTFASCSWPYFLSVWICRFLSWRDWVCGKVWFSNPLSGIWPVVCCLVFISLIAAGGKQRTLETLWHKLLTCRTQTEEHFQNQTMSCWILEQKCLVYTCADDNADKHYDTEEVQLEWTHREQSGIPELVQKEEMLKIFISEILHFDTKVEACYSGRSVTWECFMKGQILMLMNYIYTAVNVLIPYLAAFHGGNALTGTSNFTILRSISLCDTVSKHTGLATLWDKFPCPWPVLLICTGTYKQHNAQLPRRLEGKTTS